MVVDVAPDKQAPNDHQSSKELSHLPWLDGVRGLAAIWVLMSHVQILTGLRHIPLLSEGALAVDLFMMMSGFLMAHNYIIRQQGETWGELGTWVKFWTRRFFRIAPLYYILLLAALVAGPSIGEWREAIAIQWPETATPAGRYFDHSIANILTHVAFVFGFLPSYSFNTALPDWSIGLEMEFYAVFPFLMLLVSRVGAVVAAAIVIVGCLLLGHFTHNYSNLFPMPSFLPMKLYMFFAGILIATGRARHSLRLPLLIAAATPFAYLVRHGQMEDLLRLFMVIFIFYLMNDGSLPSITATDRVINRLRRVMGGAVGLFMGDASYAVYLLHLLILIPVAGELSTFPSYVYLSGWKRFAICLVIVVPPTYLGAWLLHRGIEQPGIRFGKTLIRSWGKRGQI